LNDALSKAEHEAAFHERVDAGMDARAAQRLGLHEPLSTTV
jgi:hypothetical protein